MKSGSVVSAVVLFLLFTPIFLIACGGDSSDKNGEISGTVSIARAGAETRDHGEEGGLTICALGECGVTDSSGNFTFFIDSSLFPGGSALFTIQGNDIDLEEVVDGIVGNPAKVVINFTIISSNSANWIIVENTALSSGGGSDIPEATPTVDSVGTEVPGFDPTVTPTAGGGCGALSVTYNGDGGCGIGSLSVTEASSTGVTFSSFGASINGSVSFSGNETSMSSTSTDITLFGKAGHSCTIECDETGNSFDLKCTDGTNSCTEKFS